ncbi:MAG: hypothetical protein J7599_00845 [Niabella sp.]|nr:hypothetical protein [Niabella sp.]
MMRVLTRHPATQNLDICGNTIAGKNVAAQTFNATIYACANTCSLHHQKNDVSVAKQKYRRHGTCPHLPSYPKNLRICGNETPIPQFSLHSTEEIPNLHT